MLPGMLRGRKIHPIMRGKNKFIETNSEMIQMMELVVKDINRVSITLFRMFNRPEEGLNMLGEP